MLASELIKELADAIAKHGDMQIMVRDNGTSFSDVYIDIDPADECEKEQGIEGSIDIHFNDDEVEVFVDEIALQTKGYYVIGKDGEKVPIVDLFRKKFVEAGIEC